jgi:hypothetical protein
MGGPAKLVPVSVQMANSTPVACEPGRGSLRVGAGGVRSHYLLAGVDMTKRVGGAWTREKMD